MRPGAMEAYWRLPANVHASLIRHQFHAWGRNVLAYRRSAYPPRLPREADPLWHSMRLQHSAHRCRTDRQSVGCGRGAEMLCAAHPRACRSAETLSGAHRAPGNLPLIPNLPSSPATSIVVLAVQGEPEGPNVVSGWHAE